MSNKMSILNDDERKLRDIFSKVIAESGPEFSGLGVILYDFDDYIPIYPMRECVEGVPTKNICSFLHNVSNVKSDYHDGFMMLSSEWVVIKACQYFSPPILDGITLERNKGFGGRYLAALFGSKIDGVKLCGVVSEKKEIIFFKNGFEIYCEGAK